MFVKSTNIQGGSFLFYLYLSDISFKFCRCLELPLLLALRSPCALMRSCCFLPHCYSPLASSSCQDTCHSQTFQAFHLGLQKNKLTLHNVTGSKLWFLGTEKPLSSNSICLLTANQHPSPVLENFSEEPMGEVSHGKVHLLSYQMKWFFKCIRQLLHFNLFLEYRAIEYPELEESLKVVQSSSWPCTGQSQQSQYVPESVVQTLLYLWQPWGCPHFLLSAWPSSAGRNFWYAV